jgi:hypothetical protein
MPHTKLAALILLCGAAASSFAVDMSSDSYVAVSEYLEELYGIDPNEGLTTLPTLNVPMGGRAEGMGTAFAAVSDDASFIEWNPAGSSLLSRTELAFYHNNWIADSKVEGAVFTTRLGNLGLAAGGKWLYLPFTEYDEYGDRASKGYYSEAVATINASYNLFSGYYFSGVSIGANLKGAFRLMPDYSDDAGNVISGSGSSQSVFAPMADLGLLTRFNVLKLYHARERNASAALVFKNVGPAALDEPLPTVLTTAIAYKPIRPLLFSFDYSIPINLQDPELSERHYWAIGCSTAVTKFLTMRAGVLTKATNMRVSIGSAVSVMGIDIDINYTLDLLTQLQPLNRVSLGARFNLGDGGRAEKAKHVDDLYLRGLEEYANGNLDEALILWEEALRLDKTFDPAREGLEAIRDARVLEQRIDDIRRLE